MTDTSVPTFDPDQFTAARIQHDLTQTKVCTLADVAPGNFGQVMKGKRGISPETCGKLARVLPDTDFARTWAAHIPEPDEPVGLTFYIRLDQLDPNPDNNRTDFNKADIADLADSILSRGLLQPMTVTKTDDHRWRIVSGDRRRLAFIELHDRGEWPADLSRNGWKVPVAERTGTRAELMVDTIIENLMRVDVPPLDEAMGFKKLRDMGLTTADIATKLGNADSGGKRRVQQYLQIANGLSDTGRQALAGRTITVEQARALASLPGHLQAMLLTRNHADLPRNESALRAAAVEGYARIEDMAYGIKAYTDEKGPTLKLGTGTYLLDTGLAEKLQHEAAERLVAECKHKGYADVRLRTNMHPDVVIGDDRLKPSEARAIVYVKPRSHPKGVGQITVVEGLPLTSSLTNSQDGSQPPRAQTEAAASEQQQSTTPSPQNEPAAPPADDQEPPELDEIVAAFDAICDAAKVADAHFEDVLLVRDNPQTHARACRYEDARKAEAKAREAMRQLLLRGTS